MPVDEAYRKQASLLLKVVPFVASETAFALKGGTAINLPIHTTICEIVEEPLRFVGQKFGFAPGFRAMALKETCSSMINVAAGLCPM